MIVGKHDKKQQHLLEDKLGLRIYVLHTKLSHGTNIVVLVREYGNIVIVSSTLNTNK